MRTTRTGFLVALVVGSALLSSVSSFGVSPARAPVVTTPHSAFYSGFDANLNDALLAGGVARKGGKPELFHSGEESAAFAKLPPAVRAGWDRAVDYYAEILSPTGSNSRQRYLVRVELLGLAEELADSGDRQFADIARGLRAAAAPAYRACRWTAQDEKNRRWIEELKPQLLANEDKVTARVEQLYEKKWGARPIPVDIVKTVDRSGANTILLDPVVPSEGGLSTKTLFLDMIETARQLSEEPHTYWIDQLNNHDTIAGYHSMGEEIWSQTSGHVGVFVHAIGTGTSSRAVATVLKRHYRSIEFIAVEPAESPVLRGGPPSVATPRRPSGSFVVVRSSYGSR